MIREGLGDRMELVRVGVASAGSASLADEVRAGLTAEQKSLPYRFLYDAAGSQLFEQICELPEYYLTRAETEILTVHAGAIVAGCPMATTLVELGSGSSSKTRLLIEALIGEQGRLLYAPIDISDEILEASARELLAAYPQLEVLAVSGEYQAGIDFLAERLAARRDRTGLLVLWLGSSIGNLAPDESAEFLAGLRKGFAGHDRVLVGFDLRKDAATLQRAYDDARGVTAAFSLNLLTRLNRELDADFDLSGFAHVARWESDPGRVYICIESKRAQKVRIGALGLEVEFEAGEPIHTESAYKYSEAEIDALAHRAGLTVAGRWQDAARRFSLALLRP